MHVAQFVHRYPPALGGAEAYTARLCEYLTACGDHVRVWTTTAIALEEMWSSPAGLPVHPLPDGRCSPVVHRYAPLHFPTRRYLLKALSLVPVRRWQCLTTPCNPVCPAMWHDAGRYDGPLEAVHATAFPYSFPIACGLRLARQRGVPFYVTPFLHLGDVADPNDHTRRQYTKPHLRWLLLQADGVFVQTHAEREAAIALGVPESRLHLHGLGVDLADCTGGDRTAARTIWGIESDEVVIGHLANNSAEKGTLDLLQAAEALWEAGCRFRVVLAGPEMPDFRSFWSQFGMKGKVTRLGVLGDQQKRDFFAGIDVFALPSRTDSFGLVLLEAWANGKPNLIYRAGGPAEIVRDGTDGLHARCGDVAEFARQLDRIIGDPGLRRSLGERGRERIGHEFQWQDKLELVRNVLASGRVYPDRRVDRLQHDRDKPGRSPVTITVRSGR